jgi:hypothetical protein
VLMIPWAWAAWNSIDSGQILGSGWVFLAYLVVAALLLHRAHPVAQLTARAVLGATVLAGITHVHWGDGWDLHAHLVNKDFGVLAAGCALLALGGVCLRSGPERRAFVPVAFRRTLLVSLLGSLIQLVLLSLMALGDGSTGNPRRVVFDVALAAAVGLGVAGSYRLRAWGPLLMWLTTAAFAGLVALNVCHVRVAGVEILQFDRTLSGMSTGFVAMSAVQLILMVPLLAAILRGSAGPSDKENAQTGP